MTSHRELSKPDFLVSIPTIEMIWVDLETVHMFSQAQIGDGTVNTSLAKRI